MKRGQVILMVGDREQVADQVGQINWDGVRHAFQLVLESEFGVVTGEACADYGIWALPEPDGFRRERLNLVRELFHALCSLTMEMLETVPESK